jgi:hypothetical protein
MTDLIEEVLAPAVIERALSIFESFRERNHCEIVQARKVLTPHVFGLIEAGQTDEMRLVVSALTYLKSLEARTASENSWKSADGRDIEFWHLAERDPKPEHSESTIVPG